MAQNMSVSVTLKLQDQFTQPVRQLMQTMQQLTQRAQEFGRALGGTGTERTPSAASSRRTRSTQRRREAARHFVPAAGSRRWHVVGRRRSAGPGRRHAPAVLGLQHQASPTITAITGGGSSRGPNVGGGGIWGRRGFSPNASLMDRAQHRAVGVGEQSLIAGVPGLRHRPHQLARARKPKGRSQQP